MTVSPGRPQTRCNLAAICNGSQRQSVQAALVHSMTGIAAQFYSDNGALGQPSVIAVISNYS